MNDRHRFADREGEQHRRSELPPGSRPRSAVPAQQRPQPHDEESTFHERQGRPEREYDPRAHGSAHHATGGTQYSMPGASHRALSGSPLRHSRTEESTVDDAALAHPRGPGPAARGPSDVGGHTGANFVAVSPAGTVLRVGEVPGVTTASTLVTPSIVPTLLLDVDTPSRLQRRQELQQPQREQRRQSLQGLQQSRVDRERRHETSSSGPDAGSSGEADAQQPRDPETGRFLSTGDYE